MTDKEAIDLLYHERAKRYKVYSKWEGWPEEIKAYDAVGKALNQLSNSIRQKEEKSESDLTNEEKDTLLHLIYQMFTPTAEVGSNDLIVRMHQYFLSESTNIYGVENIDYYSLFRKWIDQERQKGE